MSYRGSGEKCHWCKRTLLAKTDRSRLAATRDHYPLPKCNGGRAVVWACRQCNQIKGAKSAQEWHRFMIKYPRWWEMGKYFTYGAAPGHRQPMFTAPDLRLGREPEVPNHAPLEYSDPKAQAAFEAVYDHRLHMLRIRPQAETRS